MTEPSFADFSAVWQRVDPDHLTPILLRADPVPDPMPFPDPLPDADPQPCPTCSSCPAPLPLAHWLKLEQTLDALLRRLSCRTHCPALCTCLAEGEQRRRRLMAERYLQTGQWQEVQGGLLDDHRIVTAYHLLEVLCGGYRAGAASCEGLIAGRLGENEMSCLRCMELLRDWLERKALTITGQS